MEEIRELIETSIKQKDENSKEENSILEGILIQEEKIYKLIDDIKTPIKGKDYYTLEDKKEIIDVLIEEVKKITPKKGKDYFTKEEIQNIINEVSKEIPDNSVDYDFVIKEILNKIPKPKEIKKESIDKLIEKIKGKLSYNDLKDLPTIFKGMAGTGYLREITDVKIENPQANQSLIYNPTTNLWENKNLTFAVLTDTPDSYSGQAGKSVSVKADETGLEFTTNISTDEKVKYDSSDTTAGYLSEKIIAGSGISLAEGTGADENKIVITNSGVITETDPVFNTWLGTSPLSGYVKTDQSTPQTIGATGARLAKLWATDITCTNDITGSITGNAETVTNGVYTTGAGSVFEVPLTFSSGLTRSTNNITNDLITGKSGGQTIIGSTLTAQGLNIRSNTANLTTGTINFLDTKDSTSTTGSVIFDGGVLVKKKLRVLGNITTNTNIDIFHNTTDPTDVSSIQANGRPVWTGTETVSEYYNALRGNTLPIINTGHNNTGHVFGLYFQVLRNCAGATDDDGGNLKNIAGISVSTGHYNVNTSTSPTTENVYGISVAPYYKTGTITNYYDLFLGYGSGGGTITNRWGIYQEASSAINYLNGNLGIKTTSPSYNLDVNGTSRTTALYYLNTNTTNVSTEGETRYDADNKSLTGFLAGVRQTIDTALFTQTANKTIANTTTETTVIGTGVGTVTLPANFFTVGKTIRYKTKGYLSGTNGDNITTKIKLGSVTAVTDTSALPATLTNVIFDLEISLTCRTVGATGTVIGEGRVLLSGGQGFATVTMLPLLMTTTATVDTTASNAFDVTFTWGAARVGNSMTTTVGMLEVIN